MPGGVSARGGGVIRDRQDIEISWEPLAKRAYTEAANAGIVESVSVSVNLRAPLVAWGDLSDETRRRWINYIVLVLQLPKECLTGWC